MPRHPPKPESSIMQINLTISGLDQVRAQLSAMSGRRFNAVLSTALTRTAKSTAQVWQQEINHDIDRPTPRTQNAVTFTGASAEKLEATVFLKDRMPGMSPNDYLAPHVFGGSRLLKKFERALISSSAMPSGYWTVPGKHAKLDRYGNVTRGQLVAVIRALGAQYSPGYQQVISSSIAKRLQAQARHGRKYVVVNPQQANRGKLSFGIYERMADGKLNAIFLFKRSVRYPKGLRLKDRESSSRVEHEFQDQFNKALTESLVRLAARG